jgi:hypothetical protein
VAFYRKCSHIFLISNRPAGVITNPDHAMPSSSQGAGPMVHVDIGDVWPHTGRFWADAGCWPHRPESAHVRRHVGTSAQQPTRRGVAIIRSGRKTGLAIPPVGGTMCDRPESALVCRGVEGRE